MSKTTARIIILGLFATAVNLAIFVAIPCIWYMLVQRTSKGALRWLGCYWPQKLPVWSIAKLSACTLLIGWIGLLVPLFFDHSWRFAGAQLEPGYSVAAYLAALLIHGIRSGLTEETLFRGFLAKRLISLLGYAKGNLAQALLFGLCHYSLMTPGPASVADRVIKVVNATIWGYVFGQIMHKQAEGSVLPGAIIHGLYNILSSALLLLLVHLS